MTFCPFTSGDHRVSAIEDSLPAIPLQVVAELPALAIFILNTKMPGMPLPWCAEQIKQPRSRTLHL